MNIAETYFEKLKRGRVIVHAQERAVLRGGMAYRFVDGSVLHIGPHYDGISMKPAKAYPNAEALINDRDMLPDPNELPVRWSAYDRHCSLYLDSMVEGLTETEREKMATSLPHEGMTQIALHADTLELPESPKTHSHADVRAFVDRSFEEVKALFGSKAADEAHTSPSFFFFSDNGNFHVDLTFDFDPGTRTIKELRRKFVVDFARKHDAYAVAIICDQWVGSEGHRGWPSDDPKRREAFGYHMRMRDANKAWEKHSIYERRDGRIVWGESSEGEIPPDSLNDIPVWWEVGPVPGA